MANVRVAINGFGRIGRLAFRQMFGADGYEIVAINDLTSPKMLAHLLKYDSAQGRYEHADTVSADDEAGTITVCGKTIKIYAEKDAKNLPWGEIGVDVVLECTGFYTSKAKSQAHIDAGAKKVQRRSSSPHPRATIFPPSCSASTRSRSRSRIPSSPLLPARPTASLPWQIPSTSSLRSRRAT